LNRAVLSWTISGRKFQPRKTNGSLVSASAGGGATGPPWAIAVVSEKRPWLAGRWRAAAGSFR
jgi:hypothetical protein